MHKFIIIDWMGNVCFGGSLFASFDDAEAFLSDKLNNSYETDRGEYEIVYHNSPFVNWK